MSFNIQKKGVVKHFLHEQKQPTDIVSANRSLENDPSAMHDLCLVSSALHPI